MPNKISKSEFDELKRKAALAESLQVQVTDLTAKVNANGAANTNGAANANGAVKESDEAKQLRDKLAKIEGENRRNRITAERSRYETFMAEEIARQNKDHFKSKLQKYALEEVLGKSKSWLTDAMIEEAVGDTIDGEGRLKNSIKVEVNKFVKEKLRVIEEAEAAVMRTQITQSVTDPSVRINALGATRKELGLLREEAYGSDAASAGHELRNQVRDFLLTKIFKMPVERVVNGQRVHVLEEFKPMLHEMISLQHAYEEMMGVSDHHMFSPGGRIHSILNSTIAKQNICKLMEADEATTTFMVGGTGVSNLPVDASSALIMATWPKLIAQRISASTGTMASNTARIYDLQYPHSDVDAFRAGMRFFGGMKHDAAFSGSIGALADGVNANDEGALARASNHYPQDVFVYVGQAPDVDTTFTITCTDSNNDSATATATVLTTDVAGTIKLAIPNTLGLKMMDVTTATATGWSGTGEVGFFTPDPIVGHTAGSAAQKSRFKLEPYDVTEKQYDLQSNMPLAVIEDMMKALSAGGGTGLNLVATTIRLLSNELNNLIDQAIIDQAVQNVYSNNQITFDSTTPSAGYSVAEWREQVHYNFDTVCATVEHYSSARPNWMTCHSLDWPHITEWLKGTGFMTAFDPLVNDPFVDARAQYKLVGCEMYKSSNARLKRVLFGSNNQDTGVHYLVYVPFQILQGQNPTAGFETVVMIHHRAFIGVPTKTGVPSSGQKSLGLLKITR